MSEKIKYDVDVDARDGTVAIAGLEKQIAKTDAAAVHMGASVDKATKPTANLGRAALETSRAVEDLQYGVAGVVNNIPGLVMALGGGAGLTAAISLAAVAANQLYKNFTEVPKAVKESAADSKDALQGLLDDIAAINLELDALASGTKIDVARARMQQASAEERARQAGDEFRAQFGDVTADPREFGRIEAAAKGGRDVWLKVWNDQKQELEKVRVSARKVMQAYDDAVKVGQEAALSQRKVAAMVQKGQFEELQREEELAEKRGEKRDKESKARIEKVRYESDDLIDVEEKMLNWVAKMREKAIANREMEETRAAKEAAKIEADKEKEKLRIAKEAAKERTAIVRANVEAERQAAQEIAGYVMTGTSVMTGALQELIAAQISGQEFAAEQFGISIMAQAGQALVSYGTQLVGAAVVSTLTGNVPLGIAQGAGGVGLVAAGVGLGGTAAGLSSLMDKRAAAEPRPQRERGLGGRGTVGRKVEGGVQVQIVYGGVSGPEADSGARAVVDGLALASKRGRYTDNITRRR